MIEINRPNFPDNEAPLLLGSDTLSVLGITSPHQLHILNDWHRGGAETYVSDFILDLGASSKHLIAKACIKPGPSATVEEWMRRRATLEHNGVNFPELYVVDSATIVEEFIPYTFSEVFEASERQQKTLLKKKFTNTVGRIFKAGFNPVSFHDFRSHGDDIIVVDVGEDLGGMVGKIVSSVSIALLAEKAFLDSVKT